MAEKDRFRFPQFQASHDNSSTKFLQLQNNNNKNILNQGTLILVETL